MSQIDHVFGMDWGDARYVGDGVYLRDCTDYSGIPAVALRTDRDNQHFVIVLEAEFFDYVVRTGQEMLGAARANASKTKPQTLREVPRRSSVHAMTSRTWAARTSFVSAAPTRSKETQIDSGKPPAGSAAHEDARHHPVRGRSPDGASGTLDSEPVAERHEGNARGFRASRRDGRKCAGAGEQGGGESPEQGNRASRNQLNHRDMANPKRRVV